MKIPETILEPLGKSISYLRDELATLETLVGPLYPENPGELTQEDEATIRELARRVAVLGARVQGKAQLILYAMQTKRLAKIEAPMNRGDRWCPKHHQLDDC